MKRIKQPSTWAGMALLFQGIAQLIASKGTDSTAYAAIIGGVSAIALNEKAGNA